MSTEIRSTGDSLPRHRYTCSSALAPQRASSGDKVSHGPRTFDARASPYVE